MEYFRRSLKNFIIPSLVLSVVISITLTVLCFIISNNTAICNRIEIWIEACNYVDFFLPLGICIFFSPFFYFINKNGFISYATVRMGRKRYMMTQFLATSICVVLIVMISYYTSLCLAMNMTPRTTYQENRLLDYVFGEYQVYHPYIFGLIWCLYKGFVASLFVMFGNLLALYSNNLFVSVIGPFIYCMAENMVTALLNIPMYSIMTSYCLNRLSPTIMHEYNYVIGCLTYIVFTSLIILTIRRKKQGVVSRD